MTWRLFGGTAAALLGGGILFAVSAQAAIQVDEEFSGAWFDVENPGRGTYIDYIRTDSGTRRNSDATISMAHFTYDNDGAPLWLLGDLSGGQEFQFSFSGDALRFGGGMFAAEPLQVGATETVGTFTLTFDTCNQATLAFEPSGGSSLSPFEREISRGSDATGVSTTDTQGECPWQREFDECPDEPFISDGPQPRTCVVDAPITEGEFTFTNETTWILGTGVFVGDISVAADGTSYNIDSSATLNIEPGTVITTDGQNGRFLYIRPGSTINAVGTRNAPIIFTSPLDGFPGVQGNPQPEQFGGVVVAGQAPSNASDTGVSSFEAIPAEAFGGQQPNDSSGAMRYVQIRFAGLTVEPDEEINSFTFLGVGRNTDLQYLQSIEGSDDAIEFFGGTANVRYFVSVDSGDDHWDCDEGWQGSAQYALIVDRKETGNRGIECDNNGDDFNATPRTTPQLANFTFVGNPSTDEGEGMMFREGASPQLSHFVVTRWPEACMDLDDGATFNNAGPPGDLTGNAFVMYSVFDDCPVGSAAAFVEEGGDPFSLTDWVSSQPGNVVDQDAGLNGVYPMAGSPALDMPPVMFPNNQFFDPVRYAGAVRGPGDDWFLGWTVGLENLPQSAETN